VERMQNMEFMENTEVMRLLFNMQELEHVMRKREARDIMLEYKIGMQDPSREVAKFERLRAVEKAIGKKKKSIAYK
jgi:hypothetical protein